MIYNAHDFCTRVHALTINIQNVEKLKKRHDQRAGYPSRRLAFYGITSTE